jgi:hypothetical protein
MRYYLLVLLACLVLAVPVTAIQSNPAEVACSGESFKYSSGASIIWVRYLSGFGDDTLIDGQAKRPIWDASLYGIPGLQYSVDPGRHTMVIFSQGYNNYTAIVQVCDKKVSYVNYDKTALVRTTATTTVPITTSMVVLFMTTPAVATQVTGTTTVPTAAITAVTTNPPTTVPTAAVTATTTASGTTTTSPVFGTAAPGSGSLTVTTTPSGAAVYIDGVQRGISPAVIPGLAAGSHTVLLKLNGYQDLSTPVSITAGTMNDYSTGLTPLPVGSTVIPAATTAGAAAVPAKTQSPGFETVAGIAAIGALLYLRNV